MKKKGRRPTKYFAVRSSHVSENQDQGKNFLTCLYTNANSLRNKLSEFQIRIDKIKPDVIGITEVWMKDNYVINGYHPAFRHDRKNDQKGGGVMLLVSSSLQVLECTYLSEHECEESVWCFIKLTSKDKLLVGVCYRAPNSNEDNNSKLNEMLMQTQQAQVSNILVMGDFNYPQIDWETGNVEGAEASSQAQFFDTTQDLFWFQNVNFPTRFREGCAPSQLDLVFANDEHAVDEISGSDPLGKSDHIVITWKYHYIDSHIKKNNDGGLTHKNFKKGNYRAISEEIGKTDWTMLMNMDVEEAWGKLKCVIKKNIESHVPASRLKRTYRSKTPWWTAQLKKEVKVKHAAWKEYMGTKSMEDYSKYVSQRNKTTQVIRDARNHYEDSIIRNIKHEPKSLFKYIRSQQKIKPVVGSLENETGELSQNNQDTADTLNKFFLSVFVEEGLDDLPEFPDKIGSDCVLSDIQITPAEVHRELTTLDVNKAAGPDGIPTILLKMCADQLAVPLCHLFRKTLVSGKLPQDWKHAKITPIFKKGSRKKPGNYRPVSLTSQPCKVLERIIRKHISQHLE